MALRIWTVICWILPAWMSILLKHMECTTDLAFSKRIRRKTISVCIWTKRWKARKRAYNRARRTYLESWAREPITRDCQNLVNYLEIRREAPDQNRRILVDLENLSPGRPQSEAYIAISILSSVRKSLITVRLSPWAGTVCKEYTLARPQPQASYAKDCHLLHRHSSQGQLRCQRCRLRPSLTWNRCCSITRMQTATCNINSTRMQWDN